MHQASSSSINKIMEINKTIIKREIDRHLPSLFPSLLFVIVVVHNIPLFTHSAIHSSTI